MKVSKTLFSVMFMLLVTNAPFLSAEPNPEKEPIPTHADAAIILAKFSGLFDRYVSEDASLNECVTFLNKTGIYFGLLEIINGKEFTIHDCARVMGQIELVFAGEAEYLAGKVKLPKNVDSWEEFCTMSGVDYVEGYRAIVHALLFTQKSGK